MAKIDNKNRLWIPSKHFKNFIEIHKNEYNSVDKNEYPVIFLLASGFKKGNEGILIITQKQFDKIIEDRKFFFSNVKKLILELFEPYILESSATFHK